VSDASGAVLRAEPPTGAPPGAEATRWRSYGMAAAFLAPAILLLAVWIVYPMIHTTYRSFFDRSGDDFVGIDNYRAIVSEDTLVTALKNNALWVIFVPAFVTAIGLVFAVLTEKVRFSVAFKTVVFMPMAISLFAAGVIWRVMYEKDPNQGAVNAAVGVAKGAVTASGTLTDARASTDGLEGTSESGFVLAEPVATGGVALMGLTAIGSSEVPEDAEQAIRPEPLQGGITGVVWRDFKPGGGETGVVETEEFGLPGVTVEVRDESGASVADTSTEADGTFAFEDLDEGSYRVGIASSTFAAAFAGYSWLGPSLITPAIMIAYIWVWAGFAMVVIAAGLSAIPRDLLEAARTDGANEWQVFRRVTIPLLAPVLTVVFITMLIYVLKVFDIVIAVAPGSVQDDANVIALAMWRTSFGGVNDFGLGSAIAVFLFILVIPVLAVNIRRFRREV
jgi:alpha-glucoside transport system permease protein